MNRTDDISNLFSRFGASAGSYHEFESQADFKENQPVPAPDKALVGPEAVPAPSVVEELVEAPVQEPFSESLPEPQKAIEVESRVTPSVDPQAAAPTPQAPESAKASEAQETPVAPVTAPSQLRNLLAEVVQARQAEEQALAGEALRQAAARGRPAKCKAHIVALISFKGGVGKTTLGAGLASCLRLEGGRTLAIDLDPQNALHYHLGVEHSVSGLGSLNGAQQGLNDRLQQGFDDALLLPYGVLSEDEHHALMQEMREDRHWLARQLDSMDLNENDVVVLDTPTGSTRSLAQALDVADEVLIVSTADAASFITLDSIEHLLGAADVRPAYSRCSHVVNQFDASREFSRDMLQVLKRRLGDQLLAVVALDNALGEVLAYGRNPMAQAELSPACEDLVLLSQILKSRFAASSSQGVAAQ